MQWIHVLTFHPKSPHASRKQSTALVYMATSLSVKPDTAELYGMQLNDAMYQAQQGTLSRTLSRDKGARQGTLSRTLLRDKVRDKVPYRVPYRAISCAIRYLGAPLVAH